MGNTVTIINQPEGPVTVESGDLAELAIEAAALIGLANGDATFNSVRKYFHVTLSNDDQKNIDIINKDVTTANQNQFYRKYNYIFGNGIANPPNYNGLALSTNTIFNVIKDDEFGTAAQDFVNQVNLSAKISAETQQVIKNKLQLDTQQIIQTCNSSAAEGWQLINPGTEYDVFSGKDYQLKVDYSIYYAKGKDSTGKHILFVQSNLVLYTVDVLSSYDKQLSIIKSVALLSTISTPIKFPGGAVGLFRVTWISALVAGSGITALISKLRDQGVTASFQVTADKDKIDVKAAFLTGNCFELSGRFYMATNNMPSDSKPLNVDPIKCEKPTTENLIKLLSSIEGNI
jgi:hypothetical protein